ncbi:DUF3606 domain-containing protein [Phyllobacterium endophyticum]|uniref:DUF3606 domain-containing protein n=1 Tax=Phyllobacterium endophyticum TaxID=1149773 RepID=A0A2P7ARD1_9HYPH|nr:DUF3606 domain-containing protein [Phyllobacterium endophyticum]MBB3237366.1 hypothetical protein [Phyllobacterium endophyticum]PSH56717.1 DUF3606 domain-containing protein [Phyllobacterium endophyticum]TYR44299.1 DUF3606 domain-containing protein [Phyllobacterium endophyticum]
MADDKTKRRARDRSTVAAEEKYEVKYLMQALKLGRDDAEQLILNYNGNRQGSSKVFKRKKRP